MLTKIEIAQINTLFSKMEGADFKTVASLFKQHQTNVATMATGNFSTGDSVYFINRSGLPKVFGESQPPCLTHHRSF